MLLTFFTGKMWAVGRGSCPPLIIPCWPQKERWWSMSWAPSACPERRVTSWWWTASTTTPLRASARTIPHCLTLSLPSPAILGRPVGSPVGRSIRFWLAGSHLKARCSIWWSGKELHLTEYHRTEVWNRWAAKEGFTRCVPPPPIVTLCFAFLTVIVSEF